MKLKQTQGFLLTFYILLIILCLTDCQLGGPGKRVTTVTGRVIDEAQQPVDSVLIHLNSAGLNKSGIPLGKTYTNEEGNYEFVVDVPKGYDAVSVDISFSHNLDFPTKYKDFIYYENGIKVGGVCCPVGVGSKTMYDFTLLFR
ncbi:hypothetical protein [Arundinibacter roseus]|uniref:Carboxypeptidase regulatory-like domain-containing protein n=1 Tax=Arundinibacter roseus TaxID=2070510 RepID=A0A4R4K9H1_9BACT|nr:hypothetical protein [Arundinibacter roseus]TDB64368.1 hypothetical protein EZE20_11840 [Arundinibacter roseus]